MTNEEARSLKQALLKGLVEHFNLDACHQQDKVLIERRGRMVAKKDPIHYESSVMDFVKEVVEVFRGINA
jgi:hypothetical protein